MSFLAAAARVASRRTFATTSRVANTSARTSTINNTIRSSIERAQAEASDEAFKGGVVYTLLGVSALSAGYLIVKPGSGKTVTVADLL